MQSTFLLHGIMKYLVRNVSTKKSLVPVKIMVTEEKENRTTYVKSAIKRGNQCV